MRIDYAEALKKGLKFCVRPKRWLPFFIIDLAFLSIAISLVLGNLSSFMYLLMGVEDLALIGPAITFFILLFVMIILWALVGLWITGALVHQSYREKEFNKSWRVSGGKYFSLLGVMVAIAAIVLFISFISSIVALIPFVGAGLSVILSIVSLIVGLAFFFAMQGVIIKGDGFVKALEESWKIFKHQPFKVFLMWLVISGVSFFIMLIFALPAIAILFSIFADILVGGPVTAGTFMSIAFAIQNELVLLVVAGIIFILGLGIARVFSIKAQTEFYEQIKKHK
jgi:hypothetical protein